MRATWRITSVDALPDLGGGAVDERAAVLPSAHARGAVVVEALRVADVLEADGEADAAPHALAARRVAGAARAAAAGRAAASSGSGGCERGGAPDHLGDGQRAR